MILYSLTYRSFISLDCRIDKYNNLIPMVSPKCNALAPCCKNINWIYQCIEHFHGTMQAHFQVCKRAFGRPSAFSFHVTALKA